MYDVKEPTFARPKLGAVSWSHWYRDVTLSRLVTKLNLKLPVQEGSFCLLPVTLFKDSDNLLCADQTFFIENSIVSRPSSLKTIY